VTLGIFGGTRLMIPLLPGFPGASSLSFAMCSPLSSAPYTLPIRATAAVLENLPEISSVLVQ
jgi:hypothetical protein